MHSKRFFLVFGLLTIMSQILVAQVSSNTYSEQISGKPIYNKVSGEKISEEKIKDLRTTDPNFILEHVINKYGEVESFVYDPSRKDKSITRDIALRTKAGEPFPPFVARSVAGKKIDSEKLLGKPVLIQFQLFFKAPFFNEKLFQQFESMVDELKKITDLEVILITQSTDEEIKNSNMVGKNQIEIIPDGRNFSARYLVIRFPSYILIDREGKLVYYYEESDISKLQQDIKTRFSK